jgi:hypothetical protein
LILDWLRLLWLLNLFLRFNLGLNFNLFLYNFNLLLNRRSHFIQRLNVFLDFYLQILDLLGLQREFFLNLGDLLLYYLLRDDFLDMIAHLLVLILALTF